MELPYCTIRDVVAKLEADIGLDARKAQIAAFNQVGLSLTAFDLNGLDTKTDIHQCNEVHQWVRLQNFS